MIDAQDFESQSRGRGQISRHEASLWTPILPDQQTPGAAGIFIIKASKQWFDAGFDARIGVEKKNQRR